MNIFKSYDIRGKYPEEIDESVFRKIGICVGELGITRIAVGRDARLSSDKLFDAFCKGLSEKEVDIINLGVLTSPMLSFYCASNKVKGAMITASHNPREYNGVKFVDEFGVQQSYPAFLNKIEKLIKNKNEKNGKTERNSQMMQIFEVDSLHSYKQHLVATFSQKISREIKVVFDCSNGVAGIPLMSIIPNLNIRALIINEKPDGNFPAHGPDQTKVENLAQLQNQVLRSASDIGIIFDGDADRCSFVDEKGQIIPLDLAFLILALYEIKKEKRFKPKILFDLRFSRSVWETLEENGAIPKVMRVGNPYYKEEMHKDEKAIMAGELSGHIMYNEDFAIDDALYAGLKMIELLSNENKTFSELIAQYKKYFNSGEISVSVRKIEKVIKAIDKKYQDEREIHIDGISVEKKDVWFNIRPSNTEPLLRFEVEGKNQKAVDEQKKEILEIIKKND